MSTVLMAALTAFIVTSIELALAYRRGPLRDPLHRALRWWLAVAGIDAATAAGFGWIAMTLSPGLGRVGIQAAIGVFVPLALRAPVFKNRTLLGRETDIGLTYLYDLVRASLLLRLDERMMFIHRLKRAEIAADLVSRGWTPTTLVALIEDRLPQLTGRPASHHDEVLSRAHSAVLYGVDESLSLELVAALMIDAFPKAVLDYARTRSPTAHERAQARRVARRVEEWTFREPALARSNPVLRLSDYRRKERFGHASVERAIASPPPGSWRRRKNDYLRGASGLFDLTGRAGEPRVATVTDALQRDLEAITGDMRIALETAVVGDQPPPRRLARPSLFESFDDVLITKRA